MEGVYNYKMATSATLIGDNGKGLDEHEKTVQERRTRRGSSSLTKLINFDAKVFSYWVLIWLSPKK